RPTASFLGVLTRLKEAQIETMVVDGFDGDVRRRAPASMSLHRAAGAHDAAEAHARFWEIFDGVPSMHDPKVALSRAHLEAMLARLREHCGTRGSMQPRCCVEATRRCTTTDPTRPDATLRAESANPLRPVHGDGPAFSR